MHNAQDFVQILYFAGGVHIINENNVFHSFFQTRKSHWCLLLSNIFVFFSLFGHYSTISLNAYNTF
jgi:hypothetical protein